VEDVVQGVVVDVVGSVVGDIVDSAEEYSDTASSVGQGEGVINSVNPVPEVKTVSVTVTYTTFVV